MHLQMQVQVEVEVEVLMQVEVEVWLAGDSPGMIGVLAHMICANTAPTTSSGAQQDESSGCQRQELPLLYKTASSRLQH
jgi:hypothetical protein